ncbi:MAG: substrate-binding domain-containing protein [Alphaproteobacteria bacterium]|nr:substrate-binding domain-containing protein [Alphaproteobacteria bacterium]
MRPQASRMGRRTFIGASAAAALPTMPASADPPQTTANGQAMAPSCDTVVWRTMVSLPADVPALSGHTDTVPDIIGRLGAPIALAIFTEGNHFPALLSGEIIEPFRAWTKARPEYARLTLDNIVIVTLPQPIIVSMLIRQGISLGNLILEVSRASGFYPDIVMGGAAPLAQLRKAAIIESKARIFARNRGFSLVVAAGNPLGVRRLDDLDQSGIRIIMAGENEPGARRQYISALYQLMGEETTRSILARETTSFPGRLGIQHRDVLQAIATRTADVGIIFHHLARYYAAAYPQLCSMVEVPGAERFSSTIALVSTVDPPRALASKAFSQFFLEVARDIYPRYGFAFMSEADFGAEILLE